MLEGITVPDDGSSLFGERPLTVELLTNRVTGKERQRVLAALATGEVAERALGELVHADSGKRLHRDGALGTSRSPVPGDASDGSHRRDVESSHREVQTRTFGLGDDGDLRVELDVAARGRKLA